MDSSDKALPGKEERLRFAIWRHQEDGVVYRVSFRTNLEIDSSVFILPTYDITRLVKEGGYPHLIGVWVWCSVGQNRSSALIKFKGEYVAL